MPRLFYLRASLLGIAWLAGATGALAADCTAQLSEATVDFGALRPGIGKEVDRIRPSPAQRTYTATCKAPVQMNLVFRAAPAGGTEALNFGDAGTYSVRVVDARLDGNPVQIARLSAIGQPPGDAAAAEVVLKPNDIVAPVQGQRLLQGAHLSLTLEVSANVPVDATRVAQQRTLNAASRITLAPR